MAKHNLVLLYGMVSGDPKIYKDNNTGKYKKGICHVAIIRPDREFGLSKAENQIVFDTPMIYTVEPEIIKEMETWKENDLVSIKGAITTLNISKVTTCSECKQKNQQTGEFSFITPIFAERKDQDLTFDEAATKLKNHKEISNNVFLVGYLCADAKDTSYGTKASSSYQIAVNRKFYLRNDNPVNKTDYPHIKSYGEKAKMDNQSLVKGSLVLVDGMLYTSSFRRTKICDYCGAEYEWPDCSTEVISFDTEYLANFITQEELRQKEKDEIERIKREMEKNIKY